jgi:tRNA nucleotidyltransferase/poly(A) polymerase
MYNNPKLKYPQYLNGLAEIFAENGYILYIVGGFVRDSLLGYDCYDIDICSSAKPKEVKTMLKDNLEYSLLDCNLPLGTLHIKHKDTTLEYTTFRSESYTRDGSHTPDEVSFNASIKEDASRRDFTINALYYDILNDKLVDLFDAQNDIKNKTLRTTRDVYDVFSEDALRILRMCRICAQTMFMPTDETIIGSNKLCYLVKNLSKERIVNEIQRLLRLDIDSNIYNKENLKYGLKMLFYSGMVENVLKGIKYSNAMKAFITDNVVIRIALLVKDANDVDRLLDLLCASNEMKADVKFLVDNIDFHDEHSLEFIVDNGYDKCGMLYDMFSIIGILASNLNGYLMNMRTSRITSYDDLEINGGDIMKALEIESSPMVGHIKREVFMHVIKEPHRNNREYLLKYIKDVS